MASSTEAIAGPEGQPLPLVVRLVEVDAVDQRVELTGVLPGEERRHPLDEDGPGALQDGAVALGQADRPVGRADADQEERPAAQQLDGREGQGLGEQLLPENRRHLRLAEAARDVARALGRAGPVERRRSCGKPGGRHGPLQEAAPGRSPLRLFGHPSSSRVRRLRR